MPPATAVRVLVPALAPSRTSAGRDLDAGSQRAVATEAARLLAAALARGLATRLILAVVPTDANDDDDDANDDERNSRRGGGDGGGGGGGGGIDDRRDTDAREACQLLLTAADRLELPAGSHRTSRAAAAAALHPSTLARTLAEQLLAAAAAAAVGAAAAGAAGGGGDEGGSGGGGSGRRRLALAAFVLGRLCRRGNADEAADAIIAALLAAADDNGGGGAWVGALIAAVPDAHAVEKLAASLLRAAASSNLGLTWRASERCLRACFAARFWTCAATRHALCDKLLLRRPAPRGVLPALLRLALISPPPPPPPPPTAGGGKPAAGGGIEIVERHRATTTAALVDAWSDPDLIRAGGAALQGHVAAVTVGLYKLRIQLSGSLKSPGFNP
jgi:hypothetical protein